MSKKSGVYAGSFDPPTRGHLDIILQAASLMDELYIVVAVNPSKNPLFTPRERVEMIEHEVKDYIETALAAHGDDCDIHVKAYSGLTAKFMKAHNAPFHIRGLRLGMEFDSEYPALVAGRNEYDDFTPVFLCTTDPELQVVSSSLAREVERFSGESIDKYVSPYVAQKLKERIDERGLRITP